MSKLSNKLAAGVRKVKAEQESAPAAPAAPRPEAGREARPAARRRPAHSELHPARIWPD
jgi:hypothetical protein